MSEPAPLHTLLERLGVAWEAGAREGETVVTLPGERKLRTVVSLHSGERALELRAFVVRNPDERHEQFYRFLLRRSLRLPGLGYAVDAAGDVYVTARVPLAGLDEQTLDELLGGVLAACDEPFNDLLRIGFWTSIRREWAWRLSRGESTANLEAFRAELEADDAADADADAAAADAGAQGVRKPRRPTAPRGERHPDPDSVTP